MKMKKAYDYFERINNILDKVSPISDIKISKNKSLFIYCENPTDVSTYLTNSLRMNSNLNLTPIILNKSSYQNGDVFNYYNILEQSESNKNYVVIKDLSDVTTSCITKILNLSKPDNYLLVGLFKK